MSDVKPENLLATEIFGIDPGYSGAISKWSDDRIESWYMPREFEKLCDFFSYQAEICTNPLIFLEKVQMWRNDANFVNGKSTGKIFSIDKMLTQYGDLRSAIRTRNLPFIEVHTWSWQKYLSIWIKGEEKKIRKNRYKDIAKGYFPAINVTLKNADSLLLVEFGKKKIKYDPLWCLKNTQKNSKKIFN